MGERKLPAHRDQQTGERYRVAATLAPVHADNDVFEHRGSSKLTVCLPGHGTPCAGVRSPISLPSFIASRQGRAGLAGLTAIRPALMLSRVRGAARGAVTAAP